MITNDRKPKPQIEVVKQFDPGSDPGRVEFAVNGVGFDNAQAGYGDGQGTLAIIAKLSGNTVSEAAHAGTDLTDYDATWSLLERPLRVRSRRFPRSRSTMA